METYLRLMFLKLRSLQLKAHICRKLQGFVSP
jgi:hypothetical protein